MTKVVQVPSVARATRRSDGRLDVVITWEGAEVARGIAEPFAGRREVTLDALDEAADDAGYHRHGDFRGLVDGAVEWDVYPIPAVPVAPAWAAHREGSWASMNDDGSLVTNYWLDVAEGCQVVQTATARAGRIEWEPIWIQGPEHGERFTTPAEARAVASALLAVADETERIMAGAK